MGYRLLTVFCIVTLTACRERGSRSADQPSPPAASPPPESTLAAGTPAASLPRANVASPFPADRDTAPIARTTRSASAPPCGSGVPLITPDSIGPFRLGAALGELERRCPQLLYGWVMISDGYPAPTVAARVGGATVIAFASDSSPTATLHRVEVTGAGPRTAEGFGVGSTFGELQRVYGAAQASESDCILRVWFAVRPGLAFHMEYPASARRECGLLSTPPLPPELRVASVILVVQ